MKYLFFILNVFLSSFNAYSQYPVFDLDDNKGNPQNEAYYQDTNLLLDPFTGTYLLNSNGVYFKIVLQKTLMAFNGKYYEDLLIGEYEYSDQNGNQINTLPNFNQSLQFKWQHNIDGNLIINSNISPRCDECLPNEIRLEIGLNDPVTGYTSTVFVRRITVNNQEALKLFIHGYSTTRREGSPPNPKPTVPHGTYILLKQ
jgi:hypothetical protein